MFKICENVLKYICSILIYYLSPSFWNSGNGMFRKPPKSFVEIMIRHLEIFFAKAMHNYLFLMVSGIIEMQNAAFSTNF